MRAQFSAPPYGWPRDAIDAALIILFGSGHLRATVNGVALVAHGLDQGNVPRADFRVESATIDARQRLKARKLFQSAGIDCRPSEEVAAAARFLAALLDLAAGAGGDAALPVRPDTRHLTEMQSLAGNEQLLAVLNRHEELLAKLNDWTRAAELAAPRLPAFQRLQSLARHAHGLDAAQDAESQIEAIVQHRRRLDVTDSVPELAANLVDTLRAALADSQARYDAVYKDERLRLETAETEVHRLQGDARRRRGRARSHVATGDRRRRRTGSRVGRARPRQIP